MPKLTVLEMTQDILSDMGSDEVNSISDTLESLQIANVLQTTYFEIIDNRAQWDHLGTLGRLDASGDSELPTHMTMNDNIQEMVWVKYNVKTAVADKNVYRDMLYYTPREFMDKINARDSTDSTIKIVTDTSSGTLLHIRNDKQPVFYTTFDDKTLVFDSWLLSLDSTLTQAKSQWFGYVEPAFSKVDGHVPNLPSKLFSYYLAEAKSVCFVSIKQAPNQKEEQRSRRQRYQSSREKRRSIGEGVSYPDFGRRGRK